MTIQLKATELFFHVVLFLFQSFAKYNSGFFYDSLSAFSKFVSAVRLIEIDCLYYLTNGTTLGFNYPFVLSLSGVSHNKAIIVNCN